MSLTLAAMRCQEAVEQVQAVVRARAGLGVVLDRPARHVEQLQSLDRAVVQVHVRELGLAEVGLPAHRLVGVDRARAAGAERGEAVVLGGDLDAARLQVLDRVVGAAVAERELEGLQARPRGTAAGGRGRCPTRACARRARGPCPRCSPAPPGRPGRWPGTPRRDPRRAARRRVLVHGCSVTRAPRAISSRTIETLMPVSITAMCGPSPSSPWRLTAVGVTCAARSCPAIGGSASISARASAAGIAAGNSPPRIAPRVADVDDQRARVDAADRRDAAVGAATAASRPRRRGRPRGRRPRA